MSRREVVDVAVVGGGVVGTAAALGFARDGASVALVEAHVPAPWRREQADLRVYAFAPDNAARLQSLEVWRDITAARVQPYRAMRVWDAGGGRELAFDADAFARKELGWIIEHGLLVDRLWNAAERAGVEMHAPDTVASMQDESTHVALDLADGRRLRARLVIAADGADSKLRDWAGIEAPAHEYGQRGVVAFIDTDEPHLQTCWQRFLPGGPLAVLPFTAGDAGMHRSSIVWTLPDADAQRVLDLDEDAFGRTLTDAFGARLGAMRLASPRAAFPLRRQLARSLRAGRVLVVGDAAHVVHPLAGQGVNLGLRDASALCTVLRDARRAGAVVASSARLDRWARTRRSENAVAAGTFDALNRLFSNDAVAPTLLRGPLMGLAGRARPVVHALWRRAAGV